MSLRVGSSRLATADTSADTSGVPSPAASPTGAECIPGAMAYILTLIAVDEAPLYLLMSMQSVFRRDQDEHRQARPQDHRQRQGPRRQSATPCRPRPREG